MIKKTYKLILLFIFTLIPFMAFAWSVYITPTSNIGSSYAVMYGTAEVPFVADEGNGTAKFRYTTTPTPSSNCSSMTPHTETQANVTGNYIYLFGGGNNPDVGQHIIFGATILGLQPSTKYYICGIATEGNGNTVVYGSVISFTTTGTAVPGGESGGGPSLNFGDVGDVVTVGVDSTSYTGTEAIFRGSVSGVVGTAFGYFRYSTATTPPVFCNEIFGSNMRSAIASKPNGDGKVTGGAFSARVTTLEPGTTYYYCAVASNTAFAPTKIKYGEVKSFRTPPCETCKKTEITTTYASVLEKSNVILQGLYSSARDVNTYLEYKLAPGQTEATEGGGSGGFGTSWTKTPEESHLANSYGKITEPIRGLKADTKYVYRAVGKVENPAETIYGNEVEFRTYTNDGFGDGGGWIYNNPNGDPSTNVIGNGGTLNPPTQTCAQPTGPDAPIVDCNDNDYYDPYGPYLSSCNPELEDCDIFGYTYTGCDPLVEDCDGGFYIPSGSSGFVIDDSTIITTTGGGSTITTTTNGVTTTITNGGITTTTIGGNTTTTSGGTTTTTGGTTTTTIGGTTTNSGGTTTVAGGVGNNGSGITTITGGETTNVGGTTSTSNGVTTITGGTTTITGGVGNNASGKTVITGGVTTLTGGTTNTIGGSATVLNGKTSNTGGTTKTKQNNSNNNGNNNNNTEQEKKIGDNFDPDVDAIVRYHEGVETVFIRQILKKGDLAKKYGFKDGDDRQAFSNYLAHFFGKNFGYVAKNKKEVRVREADVAAYQLLEIGNKTIVYEVYKNKITGIRRLSGLFKTIFKYEYYFLKRR